MNIKELKEDLILKFKESGIENHYGEVDMLLSHFLSKTNEELITNSDEEISEDILKKINESSEKRLTKYPLQYILNKVNFYGYDFFVDQRVLIPRPETELLVERALDLIRCFSLTKVLDMCCGSGVIGLTLLKETNLKELTLSDIAKDALTVSRVNANNLELSNIRYNEGDLFENINGHEKFDMITANPPYIKLSDKDNLQKELSYEPENALFAGETGLEFYERIFNDSKMYLKEDGFLIVEIGAELSTELQNIINNSEGLKLVSIEKDYNDLDRVIILKRTADE